MINISVIDKIKKLLAKATDSSVTDPERDSFLNMASRLMLKHSVTEYELLNCDDSKLKELIIRKPVTFQPYGLFKLSDHYYAGLQIIANNFGCELLLNLDSHLIFLFGFSTNVEIADYAITVLFTQGRADLTKCMPCTASFKMNFWHGFILGLQKRFTPLVSSNEQGIELYNKVREEMVKFATQVPLNLNMQLDSKGMDNGFTSAKNATLSKPLETTNGGKLLG